MNRKVHVSTLHIWWAFSTIDRNFSSDSRQKVWAFGSAIFLSLAIGSKSKMTSLHADNSVSTKWNPLKVWASTIHIAFWLLNASTPSKWSASIITNTFNWNNQCLNICLLLGMTGHVSSAKAPDRLSCSNSFLITDWGSYQIPFALEEDYPKGFVHDILVIMDWDSPIFIMKSGIAWIF
jgi:hypothetical protein